MGQPRRGFFYRTRLRSPARLSTDAAGGRFGLDCADAQATDQSASPLLGRLPPQGDTDQAGGDREQSAIMKAIEEFKVPINQLGRLIAQRGD